MHIRRLLVGLGALFFIYAAGYTAAHAAPPPNITMTVGVCDPNYPKRCAAPDASGALPITGTISATTSATASAAPTPVIAGAGKPLNEGLFSDLFVTTTDGAGGIVNPMPKTGGSVQNAAGENHIGEVSGNMKPGVQVTPTTTAVAFTSGWAVGGLQTVPNAARVSGGNGLLQSIVVGIKTAQTATYDIFLFSDTSLSSTCTNAAAFVLSASDFPKLIGVAHVTDITAGNTTTVAQGLNLALPVSAAVTTVYACAVVRGTPTWGSTTDLTFSYNFIRN